MRRVSNKNIAFPNCEKFNCDDRLFRKVDMPNLAKAQAIQLIYSIVTMRRCQIKLGQWKQITKVDRSMGGGRLLGLSFVSHIRPNAIGKLVFFFLSSC